jgi:hypothetical protein
MYLPYAPDSGPLSLGENPYWVFISFLYAWIAADIAQRFARVSRNWVDLNKRNAVPTTYSHLVLAAVVVGTSWLGWTSAFLKDGSPLCDIETIAKVIGPTSLLLIVDFWILAIYFVFTEVVNCARASDGSGESKPAWSPHSENAAFWLLMMFVAYIFWDLLVYLALPEWISHDGASVCQFWRYSWPTFLCAALAAGSIPMVQRVRSDRRHWLLATDASLIALVLFYRGLKQLFVMGQRPMIVWVFTSIWLLAFLFLLILAGITGHKQGPAQLAVLHGCVWCGIPIGC